MLNEEGVRVKFIGDRGRLSKYIKRLIDRVESITAENDRATLVLAVDYGGHWDIAKTAKDFAKQVANGSMDPEDITPERFESAISRDNLPPPDLCIRTGGDIRLSNFMLWQLAYTELYFCKTLWPDFGEHDLKQAFLDFRRRERRFGCREMQQGITIIQEARAET